MGSMCRKDGEHRGEGEGDTQTTHFPTWLGGSPLPAPSWGGGGTNQGGDQSDPMALQTQAEF